MWQVVEHYYGDTLNWPKQLKVSESIKNVYMLKPGTADRMFFLNHLDLFHASLSVKEADWL